MPSLIRSVRADSSRWERWGRAAGGGSLNSWIVKRLDEAADLDLLQLDELAVLRERREAMKAALGGDAA